MDQASTQFPNIFAAHNLSISRGWRLLLSGLSFELRTGNVLHIHGDNGCGKTSLLYTLTGLRRADEGEITWSARSIYDDLFAYHQELCFIGHENAIKLELTCLENLCSFYHWQDCKPISPQQLLDSLGLASSADELCYQLSAGQRRKLSLARLLLTQAPLWILDEPFTALDQDSVTYFQSLITAHASQGGMVILTSHQLLDWQGFVVTDLLLEKAVA